MGYSAGWNATDQIPQARGRRRHGRPLRRDRSAPTAAAPSATASRPTTTRRFDDGEFRLNAYAIRSKLNLFSNFTFFLDNPVDGDQFEQSERRTVYGLATSRSWNLKLGGFDTVNTVGLQAAP